jgi:hypothetical protein
VSLSVFFQKKEFVLSLDSSNDFGDWGKKNLRLFGRGEAGGGLRLLAVAGARPARTAGVDPAPVPVVFCWDEDSGHAARCPRPPSRRSPTGQPAGRKCERAEAGMVAGATRRGEAVPGPTVHRCSDSRAAAHSAVVARDGHQAGAPRRRAPDPGGGMRELDSQEGEAAGVGTRGTGAALPRGGRSQRRGIHALWPFVLLLSYAAKRVQAAGSGLFRFGHISWHAQGSTVSFTLETAFRKSVSDPKWREAKVGDLLLLFGKEPPQFLYGDSQFASTLVMNVTAVSHAEDWVMGVTHLKHTYATPNNKQRPWKAQLVGCCRLSEIKNNAELGFELTAEVDLTVAKRSPRAATLPMITVPLAGKPVGTMAVPPSAYIPSRSGNDLKWNVGTPVDVGSAAAQILKVCSTVTLCTV